MRLASLNYCIFYLFLLIGHMNKLFLKVNFSIEYFCFSLYHNLFSVSWCIFLMNTYFVYDIVSLIIIYYLKWYLYNNNFFIFWYEILSVIISKNIHNWSLLVFLNIWKYQLLQANIIYDLEITFYTTWSQLEKI